MPNESSDFKDLVEKVKVFASSPEGKQKIRDAQKKAEKDVVDLNKRMFIDPGRLQKPTRI